MTAVLIITDPFYSNFPFLEASQDLAAFLWPIASTAFPAREGTGKNMTGKIFADFGVLDCECCTSIRLLRSGVVIGDQPEQQTTNPLFLVANYVFDRCGGWGSIL